MYVLIGGAGLIGLSLAQKLVELGHTVAVIDVNWAMSAGGKGSTFQIELPLKH